MGIHTIAQSSIKQHRSEVCFRALRNLRNLSPYPHILTAFTAFKLEKNPGFRIKTGLNLKCQLHQYRKPSGLWESIKGLNKTKCQDT